MRVRTDFVIIKFYHVAKRIVLTVKGLSEGSVGN